MRYNPATDNAKLYEELAYPSITRSEANTNRLRGSLAKLDKGTARELAHALGLRIDGEDV